MQGRSTKGALGVALAVAVLAAPAYAIEPESESPATSFSGSQGAGEPPPRVPGEVIVEFTGEASAAERAEAREEAGASVLDRLGARGVQLLGTGARHSVGETIDMLEAGPAVAHAEPNLVDAPMAIPDDPNFGLLWGMHNLGQVVDGVAGTPDADIDAPDAWDIATGSAATVVAIMDSGADLSHPDLAPQLFRNPGEIPGNGADDDGNLLVDDVNGYDFFAGDGNPADFDSGHGTHVAGTALGFGNDGFGVSGVSQRASLMVLRVCGFIPSASDPPGGVGCPISAQIDAINYAASKGARVLNGSLGGSGGTESIVRRDAILSHPEVLHVFAAGNGGGDGIGDDNDVTPSFPCAHAPPTPAVTDNIVCVAASTQTDARAAFSNFGASSVDLAAPGTNTVSDSAVRTRPIDDFSGAFDWTADGALVNWSPSTEPPLTSAGISEAAGDYATSTTYGTISPALGVPSGRNACDLRFFFGQSLGAGDVFQLDVLLDGAVIETVIRDPTDDTPGGNFFLDLDNLLSAGGQVRLRLRLTSDGADVASGVVFDEIELACIESPSDDGLELKDGTSMASPHVAGAAALLFSRNPGAPASEVRRQLLETVDPLPAFGGITTTGGRLNVGTAMSRMSADTAITGGPAEGEEIGARRSQRGLSATPGATTSFGLASNDPAATFQCAVDGAPFAACGDGGSATVGPLGPGPHTFSVRSIDPRGNADATPATRSFAVESDPPQTVIVKGPKRRTRSTTAKFRFSSDEPGSTFQCSVDRKPFAPCSSPRKLKKVKPARHRFRVRASDPVGNADPTAAKRRWRVNRRR